MESMPGVSNSPHLALSSRPNTSLTSSSLLVMRSTIVVLIFSTLHGTMPCHPISPAGVSGHRLMFRPMYSSGEKIILTASALVIQLTTPATIGMAQYSAHWDLNFTAASAVLSWTHDCVVGAGSALPLPFFPEAFAGWGLAESSAIARL